MTHGRKMTEEQRALWTMSASIMSEFNIAFQLLKISAKITSCSPFSSGPALRNIVNGRVAKNDVNVHEYDSVGKDIIVRMIGQPVFSFSFKRKYKANTMGNACAVKLALDMTIDYSLRFPGFLAVSRTGDLSLEEVMVYESIPVTHFLRTIQPFERLTNLNSPKTHCPL